MSAFSSAAYWEARYKKGGHSGAGSYGRLQDFKAEFINRFVAVNTVADVIDFGTGDGSFVSRFQGARYTGIDVSPTVIARSRSQFADRPELTFAGVDELAGVSPADLSMSLDVIYHLIEDEVFTAYISNLFQYAKRFVLIYASDHDREGRAKHVRHRFFTRHVARAHPDWALAAHIPNIYPWDKENKGETSFADFFLYRRPNEPCLVFLPTPHDA